MDIQRSTAYLEKAAHGDRFSFVLSTASTDRVGDIIEVEGWRLGNFRKNPIALAYHDHQKPIGRWHNVGIREKKLTGDLELAPDDVGPMQSAINKLVRLGFIKAVSVGFQPIDYEPIDKENPWDGYRFTKQELTEVSLVAVPANPEAIAVAKALNLNPQQIHALFKTGRSTRALSRKTKTGMALAKTNRLLLTIDKVLKP